MGEIVQPECNDQQSLFGTEVCVVGKNYYHSHRLLRKMWCAVLGPRVVVLSDIWGEKNFSLERGIFSYIEKQSTSDNVPNDVLAVDKTDSVHAKMMEFEPLLENATPGSLR